VFIVLIVDGRLGALPLLYAVTAGVLSSVVPYAADLIALRRVPARFFGVFMSVNPVLAALAGLVFLRQQLGLHEWVGVAIVVSANACALTLAGQARRAT
jgi:inner membrane transporter RhtA